MDILDVVLERVKEMYVNASEDLAAGVATDYAEYRYICGVLNGLLKAKSEIEDLKRNLEEY
jgi:hypothetical protein